jgi:hypothetical protein
MAWHRLTCTILSYKEVMPICAATGICATTSVNSNSSLPFQHKSDVSKPDSQRANIGHCQDYRHAPHPVQHHWFRAQTLPVWQTDKQNTENHMQHRDSIMRRGSHQVTQRCSAATTTTTHICKCRQQHSKAQASRRPSCLGMLLAARPPHMYATCHPHGDMSEAWHHHPPHGDVCWEAGPSACPPVVLNCQPPPPPVPLRHAAERQQHSTQTYHLARRSGRQGRILLTGQRADHGGSTCPSPLVCICLHRQRLGLDHNVGSHLPPLGESHSSSSRRVSLFLLLSFFLLECACPSLHLLTVDEPCSACRLGCLCGQSSLDSSLS